MAKPINLKSFPFNQEYASDPQPSIVYGGDDKQIQLETYFDEVKKAVLLFHGEDIAAVETEKHGRRLLKEGGEKLTASIQRIADHTETLKNMAAPSTPAAWKAFTDTTSKLLSDVTTASDLLRRLGSENAQLLLQDLEAFIPLTDGLAAARVAVSAMHQDKTATVAMR